MMTPPPNFCRLDNPAARACFFKVQSRLRAMGRWAPLYAEGLARVAHQCAFYLSVAREVHARIDGFDPDLLRKLRADVDTLRREARAGLAEFCAFPVEHVPLGVVTTEGFDATIVALCT